VPAFPTHQLRIRLSSTRLSVIVDVTTARPDIENYGINASYELVDMKTGKSVFRDTTFSRVSYDIPGQQQRFARERGLRDAENRAAKVIAENIRNRLASYFVAGT
jgi:LPS-assembly lipoprotein